MKWASKNKIDINSTYEYSDNILEGNIITQDVLPGTLLKKVKEINFVVSDGPNYDKEVILSSLIGLKLDDAFWTEPACEWTTVKAWSAQNTQKDQSIDF